MAKLYAFPTKRKLPSGMEKELKRVAKDYIEVLQAILILYELQSDKPTYDEVLELVQAAFVKGICDAINDPDES